MRLTLTRLGNGMIAVDVPHEFALKARVPQTREGRAAFAIGLVNAATLDVWVPFIVRGKRGVANMGFEVTVRLAE